MALNQFSTNNYIDPRFQPRLPDNLSLKGDLPAVHYTPSEVDVTDVFDTAARVGVAFNRREAAVAGSKKDAKTELKNTILNDYILSQDELLEGYSQGVISPTEYATRTRALRDEYMLRAGGLISGKEFLTAEHSASGANVQGLLIEQQFSDIKAQRERDRKVQNDLIDETRKANPGFKYMSDSEVMSSISRASVLGARLTEAATRDKYLRESTPGMVNMPPSKDFVEAADGVLDEDLTTGLLNVWEEYSGGELDESVYDELISQAATSIASAPNSPYSYNEAMLAATMAADRNGYTIAKNLTKEGKQAVQFEVGHKKFFADIAQQDFERFIKNTKDINSFQRKLLIENYPLVAEVREMSTEEQKEFFSNATPEVLEAYNRQLQEWTNAINNTGNTQGVYNSYAALSPAAKDWLNKTAANALVNTSTNFNAYAPGVILDASFQAASNPAISTTPKEIVENTLSDQKIENGKALNKNYENAVDSGKFDKEDLYALGVSYATNKTAEGQRYANTIINSRHRDQLRYDAENNRFVYVNAPAVGFSSTGQIVLENGETPTSSDLSKILFPQAWSDLDNLNKTINNPYLGSMYDNQGSEVDKRKDIGGFIAENLGVPTLSTEDVVAEENKYSKGIRDILGGSQQVVSLDIKEGLSRISKGSMPFMKLLYSTDEEAPLEEKIVKEALDKLDEGIFIYNMGEGTYEAAKDATRVVKDKIEEAANLSKDMSAGEVVAAIADTIIDEVAKVNGVDKQTVDDVLKRKEYRDRFWGVVNKLTDGVKDIFKREETTEEVKEAVEEAAKMPEKKLEKAYEESLIAKTIKGETPASPIIEAIEGVQPNVSLTTEAEYLNKFEKDIESKEAEAIRELFPSIPLMNLRTIGKVIKGEKVSSEEAKAALKAYKQASLKDKYNLDKRYNIGMLTQNIESRLKEAARNK